MRNLKFKRVITNAIVYYIIYEEHTGTNPMTIPRASSINDILRLMKTNGYILYIYIFFRLLLKTESTYLL